MAHGRALWQGQPGRHAAAIPPLNPILGYSRLNKGLPWRDAMNTDSTATTLSPALPPAQPYQRGGTLLLVEDSRLTADYIRLLFRGRGRAPAPGRQLAQRAAAHVALHARRRDCRSGVARRVGAGPDCRNGATQAPHRADRRHLRRYRRGRRMPSSPGPTVSCQNPSAPARNSHACWRRSFSACGAGRCTPAPPQAALRDDLYLALDLLNGAGARPSYALQFIAQLACMTGDFALERAVVDRATWHGWSRFCATACARCR